MSAGADKLPPRIGTIRRVIADLRKGPWSADACALFANELEQINGDINTALLAAEQALAAAYAPAATAQASELLVFEHDDGRRFTGRADDARLVGNPAWHRVGPAPVPTDAEQPEPPPIEVLKAWATLRHTPWPFSPNNVRQTHALCAWVQSAYGITDKIATPPASGQEGGAA